MTPLLPFRPLPFPLESAIGYLLRLGAANDFPSLTWLQAFRKHMALPAREFETFVEQTTGHGVAGLPNLWGPSSSILPIRPEKKLGIKTTFWNLHHRRWCPDCLRENGYWKAEWLITLQAACPTHQCLLHEQCPTCQQPVGWYNGELAHCRCGADLTQGLRIEVSPALQEVARLISHKFAMACGGLQPSTTVYSELDLLLEDVHLARLLELLWALGCYTHYRSLKKPLKVQNHHRVAVALPVLESAGQILFQWPHSFHQFMLGLSDQSQQYALDLRLFLGLHLQALSKALSHPELHFVRREFERFVSDHWKGVIVDRHRFANQYIKVDHSIITAKEAAELLNISRKKLATLMSEGHIQGWYQESSGSRRFLVVDRGSVIRFQQGSAGALFTLVDAAKYLGTSRSRIRLFVDTSLLSPAFKPEGRGALHSHWMFEKSELDKLLGGLSVRMHATPDCASLISLDQICRGRARDGADLVSLLKAMQSGELSIVARDPCQQGLKGLLLDRKQFEAWFVARLPEKQVFALAPAARYLGLKEHVLYWLRDRGLLFGFVYPDGSGHPRLTRETLDRFKERYVWGRTLGQMTGFGEKSASRAMLTHQVWPVTGPTVDGGTTYLFLRSDVEEYLKSREGMTETEG
ncbi:TniQ family protein [Chromobacterium haemolyticum]|uniref:TniQ family protein n=1 Tax=Chromobacterium haemolyticum TaxID=394935 RepID=UPI0017477E03|nr:TniQ family protein [Chromobacterium haemolyticum]QOD82936.1 TniQ family protein [Chromobacterium haemolyticum]